MKIFFNFLDISFGIYILSLTIYATVIYFNSNNCKMKAPVLSFFIEIFLVVNYTIVIVVIFSIFMVCFRNFSKSGYDYDE